MSVPNTTGRKVSARQIIASGVLVAGITAGTAQSQTTNEQPGSAAAKQPVVMFNTFHLKKEEAASFLETMRVNARNARSEKGNVIFNVLEPEDGASDLYLVERWKSQAVLDKHMQTPPLKAVMEHVKTAATEPPNLEYLTEVSSPALPKKTNSPSTTRNVVVTLHAKPESRADLIAALQAVTGPSRSAPGNLSFNVFHDVSDPNRFVIIERWSSVEAHEAHLAKPYNKPLNEAFDRDLTQPAVSGRLLLKDVYESTSGTNSASGQ